MKNMTSKSQEIGVSGGSENGGRSPRITEDDRWFIRFRVSREGRRLRCRCNASRNIRERNGLAPIGLQFLNKSRLRWARFRGRRLCSVRGRFWRRFRLGGGDYGVSIRNSVGGCSLESS